MPNYCPSCQKVKLVRCKSLRTDDPNYDKEYVGCPNCSSKWFIDDPKRPPSIIINEKPKKSIWQVLATIGAPRNVPDDAGILHATTYVLPPPHEYPPLLLPVSSKPRTSLLVPPKQQPSVKSADSHSLSSSSKHSDLDLPPPPPPVVPELDPLPPEEEVLPPERVLETVADDNPVQETSQDNNGNESNEKVELSQEENREESKPSTQDTEPAHEESKQGPEPPSQDSVDSEPQEAALQPHEAENNSIPPNDPIEPLFSVDLPVSPQGHQTPSSIRNDHEQARFDTLSRIAYSPMPPQQVFTHSWTPNNDELSYQESIRDDDQLSLAGPSHSGPLSPEQQHLRETLLKVISTPRPPSSMAYSQHYHLSPRSVLYDAAGSESARGENDVVDFVKRVSERLDHAIQNSPFIQQDNLKTPHSARWIDSPKFTTQPNSPAFKSSVHHSGGHSAARSNSGIHRSTTQPDAALSYSRDSRTPRSTKPLDDQLSYSKVGTPRSTKLAHDAIDYSNLGTPHSRKPLDMAYSKVATPRSVHYADDNHSLPGAFPTPKPAPLTKEAINRLVSETSHSGTSVKSGAPSGFLPIAPSHYGSVAGSRTPKRVNIASSTHSPLFG